VRVHNSDDLQRIYAARFQDNLEYRRAAWRVLIENFFQRRVRHTDAVLDLGRGYGEFISRICCAQKWAMDLNPDTPKRVTPDGGLKWRFDLHPQYDPLSGIGADGTLYVTCQAKCLAALDTRAPLAPTAWRGGGGGRPRRP
jgi:hypothetical protein